MDVDGKWESRSAYTNPDQPRFRSIGEDIGTNIRESDISCLAADSVSVLTGSDNCWPFWITGGSVVIGMKLDETPIKQDKFVWLTQEGIECGNDTNGVLRTGYAKCTEDSQIKCGVSKLARLNVSANSESVCIPTITWKARV